MGIEDSSHEPKAVPRGHGKLKGSVFVYMAVSSALGASCRPIPI
jgi:hypothetical protein